jgi:hypothetical protein
MHRGLQIPEIVRSIVNMLARNEAISGRQDLLALATVSKIFSEPALELLWAAQDSLLILIKTLPQDLWNDSGEGKVLVGLSFQC